MKKILSLLLAAALMLSLTACFGKKTSDEPATLAQKLSANFTELAESGKDMTALEIAEALSKNDAIEFNAVSTNIAPGYLSGFDNYEVSGFSDGALFGPMISSIPFVAYVFTLDADTDADEFIASLEENANLSWNICVTADEMVTAKSGDKVFFVMAPASDQAD